MAVDLILQGQAGRRRPADAGTMARLQVRRSKGTRGEVGKPMLFSFHDTSGRTCSYGNDCGWEQLIVR